jgi:hypothetical protein
MVTTEHSVMARLFSRVFGAHKSSTSAHAAMFRPHRTRMETSFPESSGQEASSRLDGIPSGHAALVLGYGGHLFRRNSPAFTGVWLAAGKSHPCTGKQFICSDSYRLKIQSWR